jgi:hypothetical protein
MKSLLLIATLMLAAQAHAKLQSAYTNTTDCVTYDSASLHKDSEIDFLTEECSGLGGYQVMIKGGDLRYPLSLVYQGQDIELTQYESFQDMASKKVEWLFERSQDGQVTYKALIHRMSYTSATKDGAQALIISKLDGKNTCAVGLVKEQDKMNEKAQEIAEKAQSLPCLVINESTK